MANRALRADLYQSMVFLRPSTKFVEALAQVEGVGPLIATALVAAVGNRA